MKITGDASRVVVVFDNPAHGEWIEDEQVLSVDAVTATVRADGSFEIQSRKGRLTQNHDGFVIVYPSWFDPAAEQVVDMKHPVFKSKVAVCYRTTQKGGKARHGYIFAFTEPNDKI